MNLRFTTYTSFPKILLLLIAGALLQGCGGSQEEEQGPPPLPETPEGVTLEALEPIDAPAATDTFVTALSGELSLVAGGEVSEPALGETVPEGSVLRTGPDSFAEVQFGDRGVIQLEPRTQLTVETLSITENRILATLRVDGGSLLSRFEPLTGRDGVSIRTDGMIAQVRGTLLRLALGSEDESVLAVGEGRVAIWPPEVDVEILREEYGSEVDVLQELAPVVEEGRQVTIESGELDEVGAQLTQDLQGATGDAVRRAFESAGAALAETVPPTDEINPESSRALTGLGAARILPPRTEAQPTLLPVAITATPGNARIEVTDGSGREQIASGDYRALTEDGDELSIRVNAEEHEGRSFSLVVEGERGFSAEVALPSTVAPEEAVVADEQTEQADEGAEAAEADEGRAGEAEGDESDPAGDGPELSLASSGRLDLPQPVYLTVLTAPGTARILRLNWEPPEDEAADEEAENEEVEEEEVEEEEVEAASDNGSAEDGQATDGEDSEEESGPDVPDNQIGVGSAVVATEVGEEVTLRAELPGYRAVERTISITAETAPVVELVLQPVSVNEEISVITDPENARILLNGEEVGRGSYSATFETGEQITFTGRAEGYFDATRTITVRQGSSGTYRLALEEEPRIKEITVATTPPRARIEVNGEFAGRGTHRARYDWGSELTLTITAPGYLTTTESITIREDGPERYEFSLEPEPQFATVTVEVTPADATISMNGREAGTGEAEREFEEGLTVTIDATRPGFEPARRELLLSRDETVQLRLEPTPVERAIRYAGGAVVRGLIAVGDGVVFADSRGRIYRYSLEGQEIWSHASANSPNEAAIPVVTSDTVFFTGGSQALVLGLSDGRDIHLRELPPAGRHPRGRLVTPLRNDRLAYPEAGGISVIDLSSMEPILSVSLPGGAASSVTMRNLREGVVVDGEGKLHLVDLNDGEIVTTVETGLADARGIRPALIRDVAVAIDRSGRAVGVDLPSGELLWERSLTGGDAVGEPMVLRGNLYVTQGERLYGLRPRTGEDLFDPISGVTTEGYAAGELIYLGRDSSLIAVDRLTGEIRKSLDVDATLSGRPAGLGERLLLGTREGRVLIVNRTAWDALTEPGSSLE